MKGKWKSPAEIQDAFQGDFDAAGRTIADAAGEKVLARSLKDSSAKRAEQIRDFVKARGVMNESAVVEILEKLPANASNSDIADAARKLRTVLVGDLQAEANTLRYPGSRVLRDVKVLEMQRSMTVDDFNALPPDAKKHGLTLRTGVDGIKRVYREMTDIDALVVETPTDGGKAKILRFEQQKAGTRDTHADAKSQNDMAVREFDGAVAGAKELRLELKRRVDISEQIDLTSASQASKVTVGPAGKEFNESLDITAPDLERLVKELVVGARKPGSGK
jgi:hypothetical protein